MYMRECGRYYIYICREWAHVYSREFPFGRFNFSTISPSSTIDAPLRVEKKSVHVQYASRLYVCERVLHALKLVAISHFAMVEKVE